MVALIRRFSLAIFLLGQLVLALSAQTEFTGTTMGPIVYNVTVADDVPDSSELDAEIKTRLEQINSLMSTYISDSDVSRINAANADQWIEVDRLTLDVIKKSLGFSEATAGAFDITVGPAVDAWKFGPDNSDSIKLPNRDRIDELRKYVGYRFIETQDDPPAINKKHTQTRLDLSAIAKGFAVDRVAKLLNDRGLQNYLIEVGGDVIARGNATPDREWRIGIETPDVNGRSVSRVVTLTDQAMATSGDYRNFLVVDGRKYSHAIDPVSCEPVRNGVASVSVIAGDCMTADALATAVMVAGFEKGARFCENLGVKYCVYQRDESQASQWVVKSTDQFPFAPEPKSVASNQSSIWPAFIGALIIFGLAITGMAVGSIFNNRPITGSCGGLSAMTNEDGSASCSMCSKPVSECPENQE